MDSHAFAIVCIFIVLDVVSGLIKAAATKTFCSEKLREGAAHKSMFLLIIIMAYACDYAIGYIDIGIPAVISPCVAAYLVLTEITSVMENACIINPELANNKVWKVFNIVEDEDAGM